MKDIVIIKASKIINRFQQNKHKKCKAKDCNEEAKAQGYCKKHYTQAYRQRIVKIKSRSTQEICFVENCQTKVYGFGLCLKHYQRYKKHGNVFYKENSMHGLSKIPEYHIWENMKDRCYRENNKAYENYGGRGIEVCDRWLESFMNFYKDMGDRPSEKHQIDRINNNGNYEPSNCRWATIIENARNKRSNKANEQIAKQIRDENLLKATGILELAKKYNMSKTNIRDIINNKIWQEGVAI